jgi:hypothetical protein
MRCSPPARAPSTGQHPGHSLVTVTHDDLQNVSIIGDGKHSVTHAAVPSGLSTVVSVQECKVECSALLELLNASREVVSTAGSRLELENGGAVFGCW